MMRYLNMKGARGTETVDELDPKDFPTHKAFLTELRRLEREYNIAGMAVYTSKRATKHWKTN